MNKQPGQTYCPGQPEDARPQQCGKLHSWRLALPHVSLQTARSAPSPPPPTWWWSKYSTSINGRQPVEAFHMVPMPGKIPPTINYWVDAGRRCHLFRFISDHCGLVKKMRFSFIKLHHLLVRTICLALRTPS